jgi:hypothetical protein
MADFYMVNPFEGFAELNPSTSCAFYLFVGNNASPWSSVPAAAQSAESMIKELIG